MTGWGSMRGCRWGEGQVVVAGYHGWWGQEDSGWWWHIALGHLRWVVALLALMVGARAPVRHGVGGTHLVR